MHLEVDASLFYDSGGKICGNFTEPIQNESQVSTTGRPWLTQKIGVHKNHCANQICTNEESGEIHTKNSVENSLLVLIKVPLY